MITRRENYLTAARGGKSVWLPCFPEDANIFMLPFWRAVDPVTEKDFCGIRWVENEFGRMPDERYRAIEDISQWHDTVKFPVLSELDWEGLRADYLARQDPDKVNIAMLNTHGIFLIPVNMLGWVDGLCAIYENREELESFIAALTDFLVELAGYIGEYIHPDIIFTGDDFAAATGPFISREVWTDLYKPYMKRIIDAVHAQGALAEFHCCGNCGYLIQEFLDVGADICQLPAPDEDLKRDKERLGSGLVLTGGWDRQGPGAMPDASEEEVRRSFHTAVEEWGKDGALIFWDGGIAGRSQDSRNKFLWLYDELHKYNDECIRAWKAEHPEE